MLIAALAFLAASSAPDFVDAGKVIPAAIVDMRYAGADNFVGVRIDGYKRAKCLLSPPAAAALKAAADDLAGMGLKFRLYDCYRPQRAVDHFVRWSKSADEKTKAAYYPNTEKPALFADGYIAEKSGHSRASTIDLTIDGLDMGSPFDFFDLLSNTTDPRPGDAARANRMLLRLLMAKHGFRPYDLEWWHFTLKDEPYPDRYFDWPVK
ncbi:MAG: M15 family metallopeptidase [Parvularculaceae bacterium]